MPAGLDDFIAEPLADVLTDWYQQPVFADLNPTERTQLIAERSQNSAAQLPNMLCCCSLAKQADLQLWFARYVTTRVVSVW